MKCIFSLEDLKRVCSNDVEKMMCYRSDKFNYHAEIVRKSHGSFAGISVEIFKKPKAILKNEGAK